MHRPRSRMLNIVRSRQLRHAVVAVLLIVAAGCGGDTDAPPGAATAAPSTAPAGASTTVPVPTTAPCPTKPLVMTMPKDWTMIDSSAGHQRWEAVATVMNPNSVDVVLVADRTFALTDVVLTTGKAFSAYTGRPVSVLPAGDRRRLLILPGRTIEVKFPIRLIRPTSIATTDLFAGGDGVLQSGKGRTCPVPVTGAKPVGAAIRGPRLCGNDGGFDDRDSKAAIGVAGPSDSPACG